MVFGVFASRREQYITAIVRKEPKNLDAALLLSDSYLASNNFNHAIQCLLGSLDNYPDNIGILCRLSVIYATHKNNPAQAIEYAQKASQLTNFNNAGVLDVLSTCYAAAGNYPKAIEIEEKAILVAKQNNRTDLVIKLTSKLNSLKQRH